MIFDSICYFDFLIKVNDIVKINFEIGKIEDFIKFDIGVIVMVIGGCNMGCVGVIIYCECYDGGFNIVYFKDVIDNLFVICEINVFVIGQDKFWIFLFKGKGVKFIIVEECDCKCVFGN